MADAQWRVRAVIDVGCISTSARRSRWSFITPNGVHLNWQRNEIPTWCSLDFAIRRSAWETPKRGFPEKEREWEDFLDAPGLEMDVHQHGGIEPS